MTNAVEQQERIAPPVGFVGLEARLLLGGEAINPAKIDLPPVTQEQLGNFAQRDYTIFNRPSVRERTAYWQGKEDNNFDRQKQAWINNTASLFANNQTFFTNSEKGRQWSAVFNRLGINPASFNQESASALYNKYFTGENGQNPLKAFVGDVLTANLSTDNLPAIQWLANIFGENSSEVIRHLVDAEAKLQSEPQVLINEANQTTNSNGQELARINNLTENEKRLLTFLWPNGQPITITEATPPPTQSPAVEIPPQLEQIVPNVNVGENIRAASQFIQILRSSSLYKEDPNDNRFLVHDLGYRVDKSTPLENVWFSTQSLEVAEQRHKLPLAILIEANHAMLLLKAPYKGHDGNWKILIYNPFKEGEEERILPNYESHEQTDNILKDPQVSEEYKTRHRLELNHIHANNLAVVQIHQRQYDISVSGNPQLKPYQEMFMRGKLAHLQQDAKNCVPYCHFVGALLNALKPGDSEFKRIGIPQFAQDFGIRIRTLEEILGKNS